MIVPVLQRSAVSPDKCTKPAPAEEAAAADAPDDAVELSGAQLAQLKKIVREHEGKWREVLPQHRGQCVVGITVAEETALDGSGSWVNDYAHAVLDSGGEVRLLFPSRGSIQDQMRGIDALLVPGGQDVDPSFYKKPKGAGMAHSWTDPRMDAFEIACLKEAYSKKTPTLGICRGQQLMNVAAGGDLIQDIPSEHTPNAPFKVNHQGGYKPYQPIAVLPGTRMSQLMGGGVIMAANSVHHQAIGNISPLFQIAAVAMDNVIEAVERKGVPSQMGVQFHPEQARNYDPLHQRFFDDLVSNGERYHNGWSRRFSEVVRNVTARAKGEQPTNPFE